MLHPCSPLSVGLLRARYPYLCYAACVRVRPISEQTILGHWHGPIDKECTPSGNGLRGSQAAPHAVPSAAAGTFHLTAGQADTAEETPAGTQPQPLGIPAVDEAPLLVPDVDVGLEGPADHIDCSQVFLFSTWAGENISHD